MHVFKNVALLRSRGKDLRVMLTVFKTADYLKIVLVVRQIQKPYRFLVVPYQRIWGKCKSDHYFDGFEVLHTVTLFSP